jgi:hypothetical protein
VLLQESGGKVGVALEDGFHDGSVLSRDVARRAVNLAD